MYIINELHIKLQESTSKQAHGTAASLLWLACTQTSRTAQIHRHHTIVNSTTSRMQTCAAKHCSCLFPSVTVLITSLPFSLVLEDWLALLNERGHSLLLVLQRKARPELPPACRHNRSCRQRKHPR